MRCGLLIPWPGVAGKPPNLKKSARFVVQAAATYNINRQFNDQTGRGISSKETRDENGGVEGIGNPVRDGGFADACGRMQQEQQFDTDSGQRSAGHTAGRWVGDAAGAGRPYYYRRHPQGDDA
jgi:hypothetical protein